MDYTQRSPALSQAPQEAEESDEALNETPQDVITVDISPTLEPTTATSPPALPPRGHTPSQSTSSPVKLGSPATFGRVNGSTAVPLVPTATGTRYGAALNSGGLRSGMLAPMATGSRQWGGGTPSCAKCGKSVYFAEQVRIH